MVRVEYTGPERVALQGMELTHGLEPCAPHYYDAYH